MRTLFRYICIAISLPFFFSCSQSDPEIHSTAVQLLRLQGPAGTFAERLSVFVFFTDADGTTDFDSMTITHEDTGLFWTVPASDCMTRLRGKDFWTGSNNLAGPGDEPLPEGIYTIAVSDLAGNEAVTTFDLVRPEFPGQAPVSFAVDGDAWTLTRNPAAADFSRIWLFLYNDQMKLMHSWRVPDGKEPATVGTVTMLHSLARDAVTVQCYAENADGSAGVLLTPVNME